MTRVSAAIRGERIGLTGLRLTCSFAPRISLQRKSAHSLARRTADGKLMFGQVPMLEIDGLHLVQSHSIMRYVAAKHGWYDWYSARQLAAIDMIAEGTEDVRLVGRIFFPSREHRDQPSLKPTPLLPESSLRRSNTTTTSRRRRRPRGSRAGSASLSPTRPRRPRARRAKARPHRPHRLY